MPAILTILLPYFECNFVPVQRYKRPFGRNRPHPSIAQWSPAHLFNFEGSDVGVGPRSFEMSSAADGGQEGQLGRYLIWIETLLGDVLYLQGSRHRTQAADRGRSRSEAYGLIVSRCTTPLTEASKRQVCRRTEAHISG